jgi:fucose 4-O-acetylase-like acetyltransferase
MSQNISSLSRLTFIDIVRGILIILVVIGHTNLHHTQYLYWFHIPAFFMLSGSLYKPKELSHLWSYLKKTISSLLVPYFYNFALITLTALVLGLVNSSELKQLLSDFWLGGTHLTYIYGVFWFVSTFAISRLLFAISETILPKPIRWSLYAISYYLAHLLAHQLPGPGVSLNDPWWAPRYFLLGLPYLSLGHEFKEYILRFKLSTWKYLLSALVFATLVYLDFNHYFTYRFDWKYGIEDSLLLDLFIPCLGFYLTLGLAKLISVSPLQKIFSWTGRQSMHIMYYHLIVLAKFGI